MYESIIKGQKPRIGGLPESFNFLVYLFKGLGQNIERLNSDQIEQIHEERIKKILSLGLAGITSKEAVQQMEKDIERESNKDTEDKNEIMDNVIKEMEDFGDLEDTD